MSHTKLHKWLQGKLTNNTIMLHLFCLSLAEQLHVRVQKRRDSYLIDKLNHTLSDVFSRDEAHMTWA